MAATLIVSERSPGNDAHLFAAHAAQQAGVTMRSLTAPADMYAVESLLAEVWGTGTGTPPIAGDTMRSIAFAGGSICGAYSATGELVGAAAAIVAPANEFLYSIIAGTTSRDRGCGLALKSFQRAWALERGIPKLTWTFDPLIRRNARFNLTKLGARSNDYQCDFYGELDDGFNSGDQTDRLVVEWDSRAQVPAPDDATAPPELPEVTTLLDPVSDPSGDLWVPVPGDIHELRNRMPDEAAQWRGHLRTHLQPAFAAGYSAIGMTRNGWYHLTRDHRGALPPIG